jgi:PAS domain S-box-containing protein
MGSKPKQAPEKIAKSQQRTVGGEQSSPAKSAAFSPSSATGIIGLSREPVLIVAASDLHIIDANAAACELYGYSIDEFRSMDLLSLSQDREREMARNRLLRSSRGKKEFQHIGKNGESIFVEFDNVAVSYAGQEAFFCLVHDITTRSQLVRALLESDAANREIIENASDIIYTHDLEGNFTSGNRAVTRVLGYTREEYLGNNLRNLVHPEDLPRTLAAMAAKLAGQHSATPYAVRVYAKDGSLRTLELSTRLVYRARCHRAQAC